VELGAKLQSPREIGKLEEMLNTKAQSIEALAASINRLEDRLSVVLLPEAVGIFSENDSSNPVMSQVTSATLQQIESINHLICRVNSIIYRVEI